MAAVTSLVSTDLGLSVTIWPDAMSCVLPDASAKSFSAYSALGCKAAAP